MFIHYKQQSLVLKALSSSRFDRVLVELSDAIVYVYHLFLLTLILNTIHSSKPIFDIHLHLEMTEYSDSSIHYCTGGMLFIERKSLYIRYNKN